MAQQLGSLLIEELFQRFAVAQGSLQLGNECGGDVHAAAAALIGEREDESRMFVAPGASGAVGANARLADFSQRALDSRPELLQLAEEMPAEV